MDEADLNCGALLHEFLQDRAKQSRFQVMQLHEEALVGLPPPRVGRGWRSGEMRTRKENAGWWEEDPHV